MTLEGCPERFCFDITLISTLFYASLLALRGKLDQGLKISYITASELTKDAHYRAI